LPRYDLGPLPTMGSRLEKNSNEVRKRIQSHSFSDEQGEEYEASTFGGFADYMRRKKLKLQNLDAEIRANSGQNPPIFRGIVAHVNGYTQPSLSDLHTMIVSHGGGFLQYLDGKTTVTHVIASHLTPKKKVEFAKYRIVKPAWIVDSVAAGRLLPWNDYRVVDEGVTQRVLGFDNGSVVSQANSQRRGYREQTDTSWYTSQFRAQSSQQPLSAAKFGARLGAISDANDTPQPIVTADGVEDEEVVVDPLDELEDLVDVDEDDEELMKPPPLPHQSRTIPDQRDEPAERTSEKSELTATSPQKKQLTAEEHNAILLSNPHMAKSSTANPDFINQYYRESRLHHLSTWKADLKAQLQARAQEKSSSQKPRHKAAPGARRYVLHVDFDSFFAAVSLRKNQHLIDKPVVIAHGSGPGSEIASCNYPARKFGVKNGMWMKTALQLCADLKVLPYDFKAYEEASRHFYDSILAIDGIVQSISIDEALIDVSELCIKAGGSDGKGISEGSIYREQERAEKLATQIRDAVREKTGCEVSVGIGNNILLAKVALRKAKPAGQHLIKPEEVLEFLGNLQVTDLPGVAWSIGNKLEEIGVKFVKDIRALNKERLVSTLGPKTGEKLWDYSRGIDRQEVGEQVIRKSVSAEINWGIRFINQQQAEDFVQCLCDELSKRLLENLVKGKQLTMKIMRKAADAGMDPPKNLGHGKCDTFNKSIVLGVATTDKSIIGKEAISVLRSYGFSPGELRGIGVQMQKLEPLKSALTVGVPADSSQRRLQFKKPASVAAQSTARSAAVEQGAPNSRTGSMTTAPVDAIEEIATPKKDRTIRTIEGALRSNSARADTEDGHRPLNLGGTQFIMPSQVDPAVLAELPADIRSKFAPKQKSIFDTLARSASPARDISSRSASPQRSEAGLELPSQSQIDPSVWAELPENVKREYMQQLANGAQVARSLPHSPKKSTLPTSKPKAPTTPTKKQKFLASKKGRSKASTATSTLTQANFVSMPRTNGTNVAEPTTIDEEISESFLAELPDDLREEVLEQQKRDRIRARSGLSYGTTKRKSKQTEGAALIKGQQTLPLPALPPKPTFTSRKLSTFEDLRKAMTAWVQEFSDEAEEGPYEEDISALGDYLNKVVSDEGDMEKAVSIVRWLDQVIGMSNFGDGVGLKLAWTAALTKLQDSIQQAVQSRGLPPVDFA
jgi:DNA repair protein REV1